MIRDASSVKIDLIARQRIRRRPSCPSHRLGRAGRHPGLIAGSLADMALPGPHLDHHFTADKACDEPAKAYPNVSNQP